MLKDPRGRLFHCPFQLYGKKDPEKTRREVLNLNAVEVIVTRHIYLCSSTSTSFSTHPPLCKTYFLLTYFNLFCLWKTLSVLPSASAKIFGVVLIKCILSECRTANSLYCSAFFLLFFNSACVNFKAVIA